MGTSAGQKQLLLFLVSELQSSALHRESDVLDYKAVYF